MRIHPLQLIAIALASSPLLGGVAAAKGSPAEQGKAIAREMARRAGGYGDQTMTLEMELRNAHGGKATRKIRVKVLERPKAASYSLIIFDSPRDVKGTALLSHGKPDGDDDQWLYLPALRRVRRISSANRSGPFAGSEFSFEDLSGNAASKYSWKLVGEAKCASGTCYRVETRPTYQRSGYSKRIVWVDKKHYRPVKVEFFDRKGARLKTLTYSDYRKHGKHQRAHQWTMKNHQSNKSTVLRFASYRFKTGLDESDFSKSRLKRVR